ncbi:hypothetical protein IX51_06095 [uncultured archaeon]|nr:hypothetical protein IX51_06095 [uncultured archaeon]HKJ96141.1 hypothetical protein [Thermoplasmataceae archaeon]
MDIKEKIISWLAAGDDESEKLIDLPWKIKKHGDYLILDHKHVPFKIHMLFLNKSVQMFMRTEIETAVIESEPRLAIYRTLLMLNRQIEHVKFMLAGMNEEITLRVDLPIDEVTKDKIDVSLNLLLTSLYIMANALRIEEEFNQQILQWMFKMIGDFVKQGKTKQDIENILVGKIGINKEDAEEIISQVYPVANNGETEDRLYG